MNHLVDPLKILIHIVFLEIYWFISCVCGVDHWVTVWLDINSWHDSWLSRKYYLTLFFCNQGCRSIWHQIFDDWFSFLCKWLKSFCLEELESFFFRNLIIRKYFSSCLAIFSFERYTVPICILSIQEHKCSHAGNNTFYILGGILLILFLFLSSLQFDLLNSYDHLVYFGSLYSIF